MADAVLAFLGVIIGAAILWEVFNDLFHPAGTGALSAWTGRALFSVFRGSRLLPLAGPLAVVVIIALWVAVLVFAFSLIYVGSYPQDFRTSTSQVPPASPRFLSALYFSFSTLTTVGYGDIVPQAMTMRFAANTEGLLGFAILTASVTSIVLLYQALGRMRLLARGVQHIVDAEQRTGLSLPRSGSYVTLSSLARDVTQARTDLVHFPLVYYFAVADANASVARWTRQLCRLATEGSAADADVRVRLAAGALDAALTDFARELAERFVEADAENRGAVFDAYASDHVVRLA